MGVRNYLVEGGSATGKTSVCHELRRRGFHAINGDTDLAYQGDPETGEPLDDPGSHWHHIWPVDRVRALAGDGTEPATFFCGGSRNHARFIDVFDEVFVLDVDLATLERRLDARPDEFGATGEERELVVRLHLTGEGLPDPATRIDAARPLHVVVDEILMRVSGDDNLDGFAGAAGRVDLDD